MQTDVIMHKSLPQHGSKLVLHFPSFSPHHPPLFFFFLKPFSFHIYVSPVSISKYPTQLGLWDTTPTATLPTTTTGWEGARAPTAGQRYEYSCPGNQGKEERSNAIFNKRVWHEALVIRVSKSNPGGLRSSRVFCPIQPGLLSHPAGSEPSWTGFGHVEMLRY